MEDKADHRVAMHHLVTERRAAGKPVWARTVRLWGIWDREDLTFTEKRDQIAAIFKASNWLKVTEDSSLADFVEELGDAEDEEHFGHVMAEIKQIADYDRTWFED